MVRNERIRTRRPPEALQLFVLFQIFIALMFLKVFACKPLPWSFVLCPLTYTLGFIVGRTMTFYYPPPAKK